MKLQNKIWKRSTVTSLAQNISGDGDSVVGDQETSDKTLVCIWTWYRRAAVRMDCVGEWAKDCLKLERLIILIKEHNFIRGNMQGSYGLENFISDLNLWRFHVQSSKCSFNVYLPLNHLIDVAKLVNISSSFIVILVCLKKNELKTDCLAYENI